MRLLDRTENEKWVKATSQVASVVAPVKAKRFSLLKTTAFVWVAGATQPISNALTALLLARALGTTDYGQVAFFIGIVALVNLLGSLGLTTQGRMATARYAALQYKADLRRELNSLVGVRLATCGLLLLAALLAGLSGQFVLSLGITAGTLALLEEFFVGLLQGLGNVLGAVAIQVAPALVYLLVVIFLPLDSAGQVYGIVLGSYIPALLIAALRARSVLALNLRSLLVSPRTVTKLYISAGQVYLVTLAQAFFGMYGTLILGSFERFTETSALSLSYSIVSFPFASFSLVLTALYYPRLVGLVAQREWALASRWIDIFYRLLAAMSIAIAGVLVFHSHTLMTLLFTDKYAFAAELPALLALMVVFASLGQLLAWSLVVYGQFRGSLVSTVAQLICLFIGSTIALLYGGSVVNGFAIAYSCSAAVGLGFYMFYSRKVPFCRLRLERMLITSAVVFSLVWLADKPFHNKGDGLTMVLELAIAGVIAALGALTVSFSPEFSQWVSPKVAQG